MAVSVPALFFILRPRNEADQEETLDTITETVLGIDDNFDPKAIYKIIAAEQQRKTGLPRTEKNIS